MTAAQDECVKALKSWGWKRAIPIDTHYVAAWTESPLNDLVAWCAPALLAHVKDPTKPADKCSRHSREAA